MSDERRQSRTCTGCHRTWNCAGWRTTVLLHLHETADNGRSGDKTDPTRHAASRPLVALATIPAVVERGAHSQVRCESARRNSAASLNLHRT
jgi:hypothetical protein